MVVILCGSRTWSDPEPVRATLSSLPEMSTVIHGAARGLDTIADEEAHALRLQVIAVPAQWDVLGEKAGPLRNDEMLVILLRAANAWRQPVACFAFHEDPTLGSGTRDVVRKCMRARVRCRAFVRPTPEMVRASGEVECRECGLPYRKHPTIISELDANGEPFLELACDGRALKL